MKRNKYIILIACMSLATLVGCSHQDEQSEDSPQAIVLSAGMGVSASANKDATSRTEATIAFPNNGKIGIIAAKEENGSVASWTSYADIQNAEATTTDAGADKESVYTFEWTEAKYWPWPNDNTKLAFLAYSPMAADDSAVAQDKTTNTTLNLTLQAANMPDVLYINKTKTFSKERPAVDLGLFKHALSKVIVEVVADATMNPQIRVINLSLTTPNKTAALNLLETDDDSKLTLGIPTESFSYPFITNKETIFTTTSPIVQKALVFPGTQGEGCKVSITLKDGVTTLTKDFKITDFTPDTGSTSIIFERAKASVLTITVKGQKVEADAIKLQGKLTVWNYQGKYESTIE